MTRGRWVGIPLVFATISLVMGAGALEPQTLALLAACIAIAAVVLMLAAPRKGIGLGPVFAVMYLFFHFGLVLPTGLGLDLALLNPHDSLWATDENLARAAVPTAVFLVVAAVVYRWTCRAPSAPPQQDEPPTSGLGGIVAAALVTVGVGGWSVVFLQSGAPVLGGYEAFLIATRGSVTPYCYLALSLGLGLVGATRSSGPSKFALAVFGMWMAPAFLLGLRGEVLIPVLAYLIGRTRRGAFNIRWKWVSAAVVVALSVGSLVRVARSGGEVSMTTLNPLNGLVELGYSIRPMIYVQQVLAAGEPVTGLDTYFAPIIRIVGGQLLGLPVLSAAEDPVVFSNFVASRFGPIGGSISAEAMRAGGLMSIITVAALVGLVCAVLDSLPSTVTMDGLAATIGAVLLLWVRNDFTPVPFGVLAAIAVTALCIPLSQHRLSQRQGIERPRAQTALVRWNTPPR